jgi:hypothetical protein
MLGSDEKLTPADPEDLAAGYGVGHQVTIAQGREQNKNPVEPHTPQSRFSWRLISVETSGARQLREGGSPNTAAPEALAGDSASKSEATTKVALWGSQPLRLVIVPTLNEPIHVAPPNTFRLDAVWP